MKISIEKVIDYPEKYHNLRKFYTNSTKDIGHPYYS